MQNEIYLPADEFFQNSAPTALTFDDISLATRYSELVPREVRIESEISKSIKLSIPILSSDMDTVTESEMAIAMALSGGMGIIHYNMSTKQQVKEVTRVKYHIQSGSQRSGMTQSLLQTNFSANIWGFINFL